MNKYFKCIICKEKALRLVKIDNREVPLCEWCINSIFYEQSRFLAIQQADKLRKEMKNE